MSFGIKMLCDSKSIVVLFHYGWIYIFGFTLEEILTRDTIWNYHTEECIVQNIEYFNVQHKCLMVL